MKRILLTVAVMTLLGLGARAEDWPQFRGPDGQGHSSERGLPLTWNEQENVAWKAAVPGLGWSSPAVVGRQVWVTTAIEAATGCSLRAICLDRDTGRTIHDVEVFQKPDLGRIAAKNSHASPTPIVEGNRVFVHFGAHGTACLTTDGEVVWRRELKYDHRHGPGGSPVVWNDLLIIICDGGDVQYVVALEKESGRIRWKTDRVGQMAYCTPLLIRTPQGEQVVCNGGDAVVAYDPRSGRELWRCRHGGHSVVPRPVFGDGRLYACSGYWTPTLYVLRPDGSGDVTDTHVVRTVRRGVPHNPSPLLVDGELYLVNDMGVLTVLDTLSGDEIWRHRLGGAFSASPTYADGRIYLLDEDGTTTVVDAGREYRPLAVNHLEGRTLASLAIAERSIFVRTDTHVYRIAESSSLASRVTSADRLIDSDSVVLEAGTAGRDVRR